MQEAAGERNSQQPARRDVFELLEAAALASLFPVAEEVLGRRHELLGDADRIAEICFQLGGDGHGIAPTLDSLDLVDVKAVAAVLAHQEAPGLLVVPRPES
jgi:hypothetical protein